MPTPPCCVKAGALLPFLCGSSFVWLQQGGVRGAECCISCGMQLQPEVEMHMHRLGWLLLQSTRNPILLPRTGALAASAVACGAGRLAAAANSLAAPIVMGLLKTLAFTRLFA